MLTYSSHDELDAVDVLDFAACARARWRVRTVDGDVDVAAKGALRTLSATLTLDEEATLHHLHVPVARANRSQHRLESTNILSGFFRCAEKG